MRRVVWSGAICEIGVEMPYAIWNRKYRKWLYGTDFRCSPPRQRLDDDMPKLFLTEEDAEREFRRRQCGKEYEIKKVSVIEE